MGQSSDIKEKKHSWVAGRILMPSGDTALGLLKVQTRPKIVTPTDLGESDQSGFIILVIPSFFLS